LVANRIKSVLLVYILRYILSVEAKSDNGWLPPYELAELIDNFVANHAGNTPKASSIGILNAQTANQRNGNTFSREGSQKPDVSIAAIQHTRRDSSSLEKVSTGRAPRAACWICSSTAHLAHSCPNRRGKSNPVNHKVNYVTMVSGPGENKSGDSKGFVGPHPKSQAADIMRTVLIFMLIVQFCKMMIVLIMLV